MRHFEYEKTISKSKLLKKSVENSFFANVLKKDEKHAYGSFGSVACRLLRESVCG